MKVKITKAIKVRATIQFPPQAIKAALEWQAERGYDYESAYEGCGSEGWQERLLIDWLTSVGEGEVGQDFEVEDVGAA